MTRMPIEEFYARTEADAVTFSRDRKLRFSASLVKRLSLDAYQAVLIGVDAELRRLYFSFLSHTVPGLLKLYKIKETTGRFVAIGKLASQYDWIAAICKEKSAAKKQFRAENSLDPKYKFFVTVGYAWSKPRPFNDPKQYPAEPGVYRLRKNNEVVRIGRGNNIADRLESHLKDYFGQVDSFDFEIVPNKDEQINEENRLLALFVANVGRLPILNPIAN
jgi:hypothetical protein